MAQLFHPSTNPFSKVSIAGLLALVLTGLVLLFVYWRSPYLTGQSVVRAQPVPFGHKHHVEELGIDCRFCHSSVEDSAYAGIPPTETCMTCHSQIWADSPMLEPVRASYRTDQPLAWTRVHDLPDFVYFDHSVHVRKGIGCATCHGRVDQTNLTMKGASLQMIWCLDCHRGPEASLRPREEVFNMAYGGASEELRRQLREQHEVQSMTNCSTCHR
ncbi:MAG: cytochrome C [Planctomycetota bacterium]|nr:MAG: cytochrome C [Planctomycetota bacterium]